MGLFTDKKDFIGMKKAGALAFDLLELASNTLCAGMSTKELSDILHDKTLQSGAQSAPLGYKGFPEACCISVNEVVCHGIPSHDVILQEGDIVNVDVTPILNGYYGDTSRTFFVGGEESASAVAKKLVQCTKEALDASIQILEPRCQIKDIARAITQCAESQGFSVVADFVGHGIGRVFHESPHVQHNYFYAKKQPTFRLTKGMTFTIEPMINQGSHHVQILKDGWTAVTQDGLLSAQFEHTLAILPDGSLDILTLP